MSIPATFSLQLLYTMSKHLFHFNENLYLSYTIPTPFRYTQPFQFSQNRRRSISRITSIKAFSNKLTKVLVLLNIRSNAIDIGKLFMYTTYIERRWKMCKVTVSLLELFRRFPDGESARIHFEN